MKNQKIIYAGITILLMLAGVFIGFISNDVILQEEDPNSMIEPLTGLTSQAQQVFPKTDPDQLTSQASSQTSIPEIPIDTWKEGESVKVDYEFASFTLDYSQSDWVDAPTNDAPSPKRLLDKLGNALVDDGNDASFQFISDQESTTHRDVFRWVIPISENVPRTGTIYLESGVSFTAYIDSITHVSYYFLRNDGLGHTIHSLDVTSPYDTKDITLDIADYIQEDGKIYGKISIQYNTDANNNDHKLFVSIDHFCYSPDSVTEHVRSEYLYSSGGVISQQLDFWNPSSSDIDIFLPLNWDSIEISPIIAYSLDSDNTMEILGVPGNTFFTLRASQNSSNQYLAISDVTGNYLSDIGFEGSWSNDWQNSITHPFDSVALNGTIVFDGSYSLRLSDLTAANSDVLGNPVRLLPDGYYYFSFAYYVEQSGLHKLYWWDGTEKSITLSTTTNRWIQYFGDFHIDGISGVYNNLKFQFVTTSGSGVLFLDNFKIFQVNHQQETIDYSQTLYYGQLNSWTQFGLIPMPFEEINLELRDRTGDSSIITIETITDSQGFFYWIIQGTLSQKEHEFRSWSWNSWFGTPWTKSELWDLDNWVGTTESTTSEYIQMIMSSGNPRFGDILPVWDFSNADYHYAEICYNVTGTYRHYLYTDSSNSYYYDKTGVTANIWFEIKTEVIEDYVTDSSPNIASIDFWGGAWNPSATIQKFKDIHLIQAQKSFFTPLLATDFPYYYETYPNNEWDFSEETLEGTTDVYATLVTENGNIQGNPDAAARNRMELKFFDVGSISSSEYNILSVRIYCNVSDVQFRPKDQALNVLSASWTVIPESWSLFEWTLSSAYGWTGTETGFEFYFDEVGGDGILESDNFFWIDQVRLFHRDTPSLSVADSFAFMSSSNNSFGYRVEIDDQLNSYNWDLDPFLINLTTGSHSLNATPFYDFERPNMVFLPGESITGNYEVAEEGIMKIIIHDQSGKVIPFDSFKVYIDSIRLFDNYLYFTDVSQTFNVTITDLFENMLYQNTTEVFENFKEIQLTLHSVKVQNLQENPIWLNIIRDSKTFSEWIYPYEIVKYRLEAATYDFKIYYCDSLAADLGAFSTNGSWFNFQYAVSADSALMVTGNTIQDVFDNVLSLTQDLDSVNTSMHIAFEDQSQNFTLQFTATNQNITFMLGNSSLIIGNLNSNFTAILGDLILLDSNINGNFTSTFLSIAGNTTLLVNQLNSNFTDMNGLIISNNTVLYTQLVHTLADLAELKGLYRVHFSVIDGAGIGLPFETVLLNVNGSRQFDQDVYMNNNTYFETEAFDWFDVSLWSDNFTITKQTEVNISIQLYWVLFENNGNYTSYLEIWRNNKLGVNITVAPDQTVSIRLTEGVYDYRVYYFKNDSQETTTKDPSIYSYGKRLLSLGKFAVSALMPTKINVSTPKIKLPLLDAVMAQLTLVEIIANVVLTVLGLAASYFVLNFIVRRAIGRHAQDPSYVPPRDRDDWLDQLEKKAGLQTDDEGLW